MTGMVIDYTLEPFWVPDLHPRSQEHHPEDFTGFLFVFFGDYFEKIRNHFLTLEDVPYSWDGDQEPKMVPMNSQ